MNTGKRKTMQDSQKNMTVTARCARKDENLQRDLGNAVVKGL